MVDIIKCTVAVASHRRCQPNPLNPLARGPHPKPQNPAAAAPRKEYVVEVEAGQPSGLPGVGLPKLGSWLPKSGRGFWGSRAGSKGAEGFGGLNLSHVTGYYGNDFGAAATAVRICSKGAAWRLLDTAQSHSRRVFKTNHVPKSGLPMFTNNTPVYQQHSWCSTQLGVEVERFRMQL